MYLTCVSMDRTHPSTWQALSDCCDMHRNVMRLFSSAPNMRSEGQILYRVLEEGGQTHLYIASAERPDLSQAAWLHRGRDARQRELSPVLELFLKGDVFLFDLLTHPSKKVDVGRNNSSRIFLRNQEERRAWLTRQGVKYGFELVTFREDDPHDIRGKRKTGMIVLRTVRFTGILRITDAVAFRRAYVEGIGPEKAYGLGMLMLRRG